MVGMVQGFQAALNGTITQKRCEPGNIAEFWGGGKPWKGGSGDSGIEGDGEKNG